MTSQDMLPTYKKNVVFSSDEVLEELMKHPCSYPIEHNSKKGFWVMHHHLGKEMI